jgi:hypothetical protein
MPFTHSTLIDIGTVNELILLFLILYFSFFEKNIHKKTVQIGTV